MCIGRCSSSRGVDDWISDDLRSGRRASTTADCICFDTFRTGDAHAMARQERVEVGPGAIGNYSLRELQRSIAGSTPRGVRDRDLGVVASSNTTPAE